MVSAKDRNTFDLGTYIDIRRGCFNYGNLTLFMTRDVTCGYRSGENGTEQNGRPINSRCKIERGLKVPTATLGSRGVKRK